MKRKIILLMTAVVCLMCGCASQQTSHGTSTQSRVSEVLEERMNETGFDQSLPSQVPFDLKNENKNDDTTLVSSDENAIPSYDTIDCDLTSLGADMTYAQVYDMMVNPDAYVGKVVKVSGIYTYYKDPTTNIAYKTIIIQDALACCAQGMEFKEVSGQSLPSPVDVTNSAEESTITVVGEFGYYLEDSYVYIELRNAKIL